MQKIEYLPIENIKINPNNPRVIKDENFKVLCESIKKNLDYFETRPILVNKEMVIFAGNMRYLAAKHVGLKEVPVGVLDVLLEREKELLLRDNIQNGQWNWDMLVNFDESMLVDVGFSEDEMRMNFGLLEANDEVLDVERLGILAVYPPEVPKLKEWIGIYFDDKGKYDLVKKAIVEKKIDAESVFRLL